MRTSAAGIWFLEEVEGCKLRAYQDAAGVWTIGIGCTRWFDGRPVRSSDVLRSHDEARALLRLHLPHYERVVTAAQPDDNQQAFDAALSLCFNIGRQAFAGSTFARRWRDGDIHGAAEALTWWAKITVHPGEKFPRGCIAAEPTLVDGGTLIFAGKRLTGMRAAGKTKCWHIGLKSRRRKEKILFLSAYEKGEEMASRKKPAAAKTKRVETQRSARDIPSESELIAMIDQPLALLASCTHKHAISAMAEVLGEYIYPDIPDSVAELPPPIKYRLTATLDDDYPELRGLSISRTAPIVADSDGARAEAQYRAARALVAAIEARIKALGYTLA